jgi:hypothetical protein
MAYIGNVYAGDTTRVYMGVNEAGFAVMNANTYNLNDILADGIDDGRIMRMALEKCRSVEDFEAILEATSVMGRQDCWNFGVMDAQGGGAMFECANYSFRRYDVRDTLNEGDGLILRATFSLSGGDNHDGFPRYKRATQLVTERLRTGRVDVEYILQTLARDLANPIDNPYPLPYFRSQYGRPAGFILARDVTINRTLSRSLVVIQGVAPGEDPCLSTVWGMIGQPALSVAYPLWVRAGSVPAVLNAGTNVPMYVQVMNRHGRLYSLRGDGNYLNSHYLIGKNGIGLFTYTLPLESGIIEAVDGYLQDWRVIIPPPEVFQSVQSMMADSIFRSYLRIPTSFPDDVMQGVPPVAGVRTFPNPFNTTTTISLTGVGDGKPVAIRIFNLLGQQVYGSEVVAREGGVTVWDGRDSNGNRLASGVYLINAAGADFSATTKSIMMK